MREAGRELRMHVDLDSGPILPFDEVLAGYDPGAHVTDDLFDDKLAFTTLLNFPVYTLEEKLAPRRVAGRGGSGPRRASPTVSRRASPPP